MHINYLVTILLMVILVVFMCFFELSMCGGKEYNNNAFSALIHLFGLCQDAKKNF